MSDTRGELKYPLAQGRNNPKVILGLIIVLVAIQAGLFVWTMRNLSESREAIKKAEKLITQLKQYSAPVGKKKAPAAVSKPVPATQSKKDLSGVSYSFDTPDSQPKTGKELLLVKKNVNSSTEKIAVLVDEKSRLGSTGKGLRIDYQFNNPPAAGDWVGVEFITPAKGSELSFWIRGDAKAGFSKKIKLLVLDGGQKRTLTLPIASIGTFWKRIQFPLNGNLETVRLVIESDGTSAKGAYNLDKFEIR